MPSQHPTAITSWVSRLLGFHASDQTGAPRWILTFSPPVLSLTDTHPSYCPSARCWPSLVHPMQRTLLLTLCFCTDFCCGAQSPKSLAVADASCIEQGLNARHCTDSLWLYLRMPSASDVQMMMVLSAPPDANLDPSKLHDTAYTASL